MEVEHKGTFGLMEIGVIGSWGDIQRHAFVKTPRTMNLKMDVFSLHTH